MFHDVLCLNLPVQVQSYSLRQQALQSDQNLPPMPRSGWQNATLSGRCAMCETLLQSGLRQCQDGWPQTLPAAVKSPHSGVHAEFRRHLLQRLAHEVRRLAWPKDPDLPNVCVATVLMVHLPNNCGLRKVSCLHLSMSVRGRNLQP